MNGACCHRKVRARPPAFAVCTMSVANSVAPVERQVGAAKFFTIVPTQFQAKTIAPDAKVPFGTPRSATRTKFYFTDPRTLLRLPNPSAPISMYKPYSISITLF